MRRMMSFSHGWVDLLLALVVVAALLVGLGVRGAEGAAGATPKTGWSIVPSPNVDGVDSRLMDVVGVDDTEAWAVGLDGTQALIESWDGTAWSIASLPPLSGESALYGVDALPSGQVLAVGTAGKRTLVLRWLGSGWQVLPSPNVAGVANRLLSVSARSRRDAWAVGKAGTGVVVEHWNGKAWSLVSHPPLRTPSVLTTVLAWPHGSVWVVGAESRPSIGFDNALSMRWTGSRWVRRPVPLPKSPWGAARSRLEGLAIGLDGLWTAGWFTPDEASSGPEPIGYLWFSGAWHSVWFKGRADTSYTIPYGLWGSPSHRVWTVGVSGPYTWSMKFSSEWDEVDTPNVLAPEDGNNVLRDVDGSSGIEWAVGYADARISPDQTLIMRYQG